MDPIPDKDVLHWGISPEEIVERQEKDQFCQNIRKRIVKEGAQSHIPILSGRGITYALCRR